VAAVLIEPEHSPYELRFRLFGTHVRVHPMFWLLAAVLGWNQSGQRIEFLLVWIGCVFLSILLHEFGHVWAGRVFGAHGEIVLYAMGGLAVGASRLFEWWKRVIVYLAGPAVQLALYAALRYGVPRETLRDLPEWAIRAYFYLVLINWFWALFNLLPVWPLDGGQISREICVKIFPRRGLRISLGISFVVALVLALNELSDVLDVGPFLPYVPTGHGWWNVILFGMFAYESFELLRRESRRNYWDDRDPWEKY
jgi:Zn-dependent protease